jgi:hypothetical protein
VYVHITNTVCSKSSTNKGHNTNSQHTHTHNHTFGGVLEDQIHARLVIEVAIKTEDVVVPQVRLSWKEKSNKQVKGAVKTEDVVVPQVRLSQIVEKSN